MLRDLFVPHAVEVAPKLLNSTLSVDSPEGAVALRITEVEAYHGVGTPGPYDAGSHARDRKTERNASMFGEPGHAYVYFTYGMHYALNLVCSPCGTASGVLIRAGEVIAGADIARSRREALRTARHGAPKLPLPDTHLARGPGNVATALGVTRAGHDGHDLWTAPFNFDPPRDAPEAVLRGPRVGVSGAAGGHEFPWRWWIAGDATVSSYRPGKNVPKLCS